MQKCMHLIHDSLSGSSVTRAEYHKDFKDKSLLTLSAI
jgi:hypothetical protein